MGTGGSSSKKRSASSAKKKEKRSQNLSEVRRKKISKSRNRRNKTVKPCSRKKPVLDSDNDNSRSSYTTSESDYGCKKKRPRSHTRRIIRRRKKRARISSCSEESSHDSAVHYRKKKGLKKPSAANLKKKSLKKKCKRDLSVSSKSTVSRSCSPFFDRDKKEPIGEEILWDKKCEEIVSIDDHHDVVLNHPKRLKSVITFAEEEDGMYGRELDKHVIEGEMIYTKHVDYPCKNSDNNNVDSKKDLNDFAIEKREDVKIVSSNADDLESVLRLKALENLRRYQCRAKSKDKSDVKQVPSAAKVDVVKNINKPPEEDTKISDVNRINIPRMDSSHFLLNDLKPIRSGFAKQDSISPPVDSINPIDKPSKNPSMQNPVPKKEDPVCNIPRIDSSHFPLNDPKPIRSGVVKQDLILADSINPRDKPSKKSSMQEPVPKKEDTVCKNSDAKGEASNITHPVKIGEGESMERSQYEQKTMSVMRGGELVEVSYKVYIPQKGPGLGRRQVKH